MNWKRDFNWAGAIELNRVALNRIIAALFALLGLDGDATAVRIPHPLHRAVLRVLRPAESAVRRLVVIAARGLVVKVAPSRPMPKGQIISKSGGSRLPAFRLFDPRKHFPELVQRRLKYSKNPPRIHVFPYDSMVAAPRPVVLSPPPDGLVNSARITRRLQALKSALDDLPGQAKRLVRATARREKVPILKFQSPLRPGQPPGHRKKPIHEIDEILTECHALAWEALKPDTS
ncbi:MAG TPA: hypothetical protein VM144_11950 [Aestuariivirga sp.]|nr:hypothetical protein [Aestuariivirga sp.]